MAIKWQSEIRIHAAYVQEIWFYQRPNASTHLYLNKKKEKWVITQDMYDKPEDKQNTRTLVRFKKRNKTLVPRASFYF